MDLRPPAGGPEGISRRGIGARLQRRQEVVKPFKASNPKGKRQLHQRPLHGFRLSPPPRQVSVEIRHGGANVFIQQEENGRRGERQVGPMSATLGGIALDGRAAGEARPGRVVVQARLHAFRLPEIPAELVEIHRGSVFA